MNTPRFVTAAFLAIGTAVLISGCSSHPVAREAAVPEPVSTMRIGLTEWEIVTPDRSLATGEVTFHVTNVGATAHDFVATGELGTWRTPVLRPGAESELVVRTVPGELLHLDCGVPGHHSAGMHERLQVTTEPETP